jgi:glycosyltransferase involved in cell wall biosynthesis
MPAETADVDARMLLALHARKSAPAVAAFRERAPGRPVAVLLTGSDLHIDLPLAGAHAGEVLATMRDADLLVIAQEGSRAEVPKEFLPKLHRVPKSVDIPLPPHAPPDRADGLRVVIAAHVRPLKDPFRAADAARLLDEESGYRVRIDHYGDVVDEEMRTRIEWENFSSPHYHWYGPVSREEMVAELARCHVHLNTSLMEGGANSVAEAMQIGVPVVATRIPGNTGMLGDDYAGYFETKDSLGLAEVLERCARDNVYLARLAEQVRARAKTFTREAEKAGWLEVVREVC